MPAARNFYSILGVPHDVDADALKKAYKKQAVKFHPDKHASKSEAERAAAEAKFKDVAEAFEVLSDSNKREVYDRFGEEGLKQGGAPPPPGSGMGGGGMPGFAGGAMPGGVHFSFSGPGGSGGGMDAARAEAIFRQFFASSGTRGAGADDDPFASLLGGGLGGGGLNGFSGLGGGFGGGSKRRRASHTPPDTLPPGTVVRLTGLSSDGLNGTAATVSTYDATRQRYVVEQADGSSIAVKLANVRQVLTDATVVGTSKAELNGKVAAAATFDAASGRYQCEGLTSAGSVVSLKPENVRLPHDCRVTVSGVSSRPALNGRVGRVAAIEKDRYVVKLSQPDETVSLHFGAVAAC